MTDKQLLLTLTSEITELQHKINSLINDRDEKILLKQSICDHPIINVDVSWIDRGDEYDYDYKSEYRCICHECNKELSAPLKNLSLEDTIIRLTDKGIRALTKAGNIKVKQWSGKLKDAIWQLKG